MSILEQGLEYTPVTMELNRWMVACNFQEHLHNVGGYSKQNIYCFFPLSARKLQEDENNKLRELHLYPVHCNHHLTRSPQELSELGIMKPILSRRKLGLKEEKSLLFFNF